LSAGAVVTELVERVAVIGLGVVGNDLLQSYNNTTTTVTTARQNDEYH